MGHNQHSTPDYDDSVVTREQFDFIHNNYWRATTSNIAKKVELPRGMVTKIAKGELCRHFSRPKTDSVILSNWFTKASQVTA